MKRAFFVVIAVCCVLGVGYFSDDLDFLPFHRHHDREVEILGNSTTCSADPDIVKPRVSTVDRVRWCSNVGIYLIHFTTNGTPFPVNDVVLNQVVGGKQCTDWLTSDKPLGPNNDYKYQVHPGATLGNKCVDPKVILR